jgi:hypothetical protein
MADGERFDQDSAYAYHAFDKWPYRPVFLSTTNTRTWLAVREGFYEASLGLVKKLAAGQLSEDLEGVAAVYLYRHYLELSLKRLILEGRWLKTPDKNAIASEVEQLKKQHFLDVLWQLVVTDAKPKFSGDGWKSFDTEFARKCIFEFHAVDPRGTAFRYADCGAEKYLVNFRQLAETMVHVHQVLDGMITWLVETYGQNAEWEDILNSF